jgi:type IV pilus assembly protein PilM
MNPWNHMNVFRLRDSSSSVPDLSSAFDPARTGDPVGSPAGDLGLGRVGDGVGPTIDAPRRNPIGFGAPVEIDRPVPTRYRTEISFKRHQAAAAPRSSARFEVPGDSASADTAWGASRNDTAYSHAPEGESADVTTSAGGLLEESTPGTAGVIEEPASVPFYKRELSFRRRQKDNAPEVEPVPDAADGEEIVADAVADAEPVIAQDQADDPEQATWHDAGGASVDDEPAVEAVDHASEPAISDEPPVEPAVMGAMGEAEEVAEPEVFEIEPAEAEHVAEAVVAEHVAEQIEIEPEIVAEPMTDDAVAGSVEPELPVADADDAFADDEAVTGDESAADEAPAETDVSQEIPVVVASDEASSNGRSRFSRRKGDSTPTTRRKRGGRGSRAGGGKVVGLKIGASQLAAAVVVETDGRHELVEVARRPLEAGVVIDGEVRDAEALTHAIKTFFDEHKLPRKNVRIGLSSNRIGVRTLDIVGIDDDERFDNAVRFKAHEVLPVAVNESVLDYRILDERPNEAGEALRRVLLVVAPRDQVEPYVDVAARAGIQLGGIDLEALALLRAFVEPRPFATRALDDTATVVVSIGHESTTLLVAGGGACEFTRVFDWGGATLQSVIADELDLPQLEAATVLRHLSLTGPGRQLETLDDAARAGALDAVRQRLTPFAREFVSSLQFYQTQPESLGIGEILLTGGTSHLEGLADALHQMIGVDVRVGDPVGRVHVATELGSSIDATIGSMAVPIGLAIQDDRMRGVDLLPKEARDAASKKPSLVAVAAPVAVAIPLVAIGLLFASAHGSVSGSQSELDALQSQIAALPEPVVPQIDAALQGAQAQRALAVANVLGGRVKWDAVLNDLARVLPANVWLNQLSAKQAPPPVAPPEGGEAPAPAPAAVSGAPSGVVIDGFTYSQPDVARLLARLAALRSLTGVTLQSTAKEEVGDKPVFHFTIVADLNETGGTP